jgi:hypothetical protein
VSCTEGFIRSIGIEDKKGKPARLVSCLSVLKMRILSVKIQFFSKSEKVTQKQFQDDSIPSVPSMDKIFSFRISSVVVAINNGT